LNFQIENIGKKSMHKIRLLILPFLISTCISSPIWADEITDRADKGEDIKYKVTTGFDYSSGDYGNTEKTKIWYVPVIGKAEFGDCTVKVTVPWLKIKGPGAVVGGGDTSVNQTGGNAVTTEQGLGDIVASLGYSFDLYENETFLDITGKVKLPTADKDKGLGTGEFDYTIGAEFTQMIGDAYLSIGGARKFVGSNQSLNLNDVWIASLGAGYKVTPKTDVGFSYDWRESASNGTEPSDSTIYLNYKVSPDVNIQIYGVTGFSDASADSGGGMMIGRKF